MCDVEKTQTYLPGEMPVLPLQQRSKGKEQVAKPALHIASDGDLL
jgi:hypothetical protein